MMYIEDMKAWYEETRTRIKELDAQAKLSEGEGEEMYSLIIVYQTLHKVLSMPTEPEWTNE